MTHYVCTGECGGVSERPGVCNAETCSKFREPLVKCNCEDGLHSEVKKKIESEPQPTN